MNKGECGVWKLNNEWWVNHKEIVIDSLIVATYVVMNSTWRWLLFMFQTRAVNSPSVTRLQSLTIPSCEFLLIRQCNYFIFVESAWSCFDIVLGVHLHHLQEAFFSLVAICLRNQHHFSIANWNLVLECARHKNYEPNIKGKSIFICCRCLKEAFLALISSIYWFRQKRNCRW